MASKRERASPVWLRAQTERGLRAPSAAFKEACERHGVAERLRPALWALHGGWPREGSEAERLRVLVADYAHWCLFERSRRGDAQATERFERHWRMAARRFVGRGLSAQQVDEFTSAFFERVYARLQGFAFEAPFVPTLHTVLLNLARDELRRVRRALRRETSLDESHGALSLVSLDPTPEARLLDAERRQRVERALATLADDDRQILVACLVEGRSGDEVAAHLGIARNALYQRLSRAKQRLRLALGGDPRDP